MRTGYSEITLHEYRLQTHSTDFPIPDDLYRTNWLIDSSNTRENSAGADDERSIII